MLPLIESHRRSIRCLCADLNSWLVGGYNQYQVQLRWAGYPALPNAAMLRERSPLRGILGPSRSLGMPRCFRMIG